MIDIQYRSLDRWPRKRTVVHARSRFGEDHQATLHKLERELRHLNARDVVILMDITASDLRRDGKLLAGTRPRTPGVILSFVGKHGPVQMPCDRYDDYRDNMRAIAVSLEALRAVDRHGVTSSGEQYRGWTALPSSIEMPAAEFGSVEEAARFLIRVAWGERDDSPPSSLESPEVLTACFRDASRKAHPDLGGSNELMAKVNRERDLIVAEGCR